VNRKAYLAFYTVLPEETVERVSKKLLEKQTATSGFDPSPSTNTR